MPGKIGDGEDEKIMRWREEREDEPTDKSGLKFVILLFPFGDTSSSVVLTCQTLLFGYASSPSKYHIYESYLT